MQWACDQVVRGIHGHPSFLVKFGMEDTVSAPCQAVHDLLVDNSVTLASLFMPLRVVPTGHSLPLVPAVSLPTASDIDSENLRTFDVFWHVWKPATKYRKNGPCDPDFEMVVVE